MIIKKVGVVGAGMMGAEIALCFAKKKMPVLLSDVTQELAANGKKKQEEVLDKSIAKGRFPAEEKQTVLDCVTTTGELKDLADCDIVIEAVLENFEIKSKVYQQLDSICKQETIIASNTSSISITKLASAVSKERVGKFIGTHFNSPASVMKLVEIVPALLTDEATTLDTIQLMTNIEKEPVQVKDVVGFGLNRLFHVFYLEACRLVEEGVCSVEDVDKICVHGLGHPAGIFKILDHTGHDLNQSVDQILFDAYGDRFRPSPQIQRLIDAGRLGRKAGNGFYDYSKK